MRYLTCTFFLCFCLQADQVVLSNGDTITGAIIKKDGAKLTIKSEFLGEVSMPWKAVKSIKSDVELNVVLPGGESVKGKISTSGEAMEVAAPSGVKSAPLTGVGAVRNDSEQHAWERMQHPGILELWTGTFDVGAAAARGNARTATETTAFNANRSTMNDKITTYFNQIYGTAQVNGVSAAVASAVRGGWTYSRQITPRFFFNTLNDYEHDRFQNLDIRFVGGAGLGWNAVKQERTKLDLSGGGDYDRDNFSDHTHRNSGEINYGDLFTYKASAVTTITQAFRMFSNLSHSGEYRINFDLSAVTAIKKWLGFHLTASDRFLSNPAAGRQRNDILISTGFRLSFAK